MTVTNLAGHLWCEQDTGIRWKYVWEFFEEYRWASPEERPALLDEEPAMVGDEQWDVLPAAIAEHLTAQLDLAPPAWTRPRVPATPWFPSSLRSKQMEALVSAPAAFRKHGIYLSARDLEAA